RLRIARQRDHVVLAKDAPLVEDCAADLAQYDAVPVRDKTLVAPGILHGLKIDPAHAAPLRCMTQDIADLTIVDAFSHCGDECRRQTGLFEVGESHCVSAPQIGATDCLQGCSA